MKLEKQITNIMLGLQVDKNKFDVTTDNLTREVLQELYKYEFL